MEEKVEAEVQEFSEREVRFMKLALEQVGRCCCAMHASALPHMLTGARA